MAGDFWTTDEGFDNYSDTNNSTFSNADSNASLVPFSSDVLVEGDGTYNQVPTITDSPQSNSDGPYTGWQNLLGSIGTTIQNAPKIGTALGTAVGNAEHNINQGVANYNHAQSAAASGNNLSTWFQNASTTDKLMIGLAVIGIIVALEK
jgi:hypothetical protein